MTQPSGGGNDINLAALWVPVMPETSGMGEEMRKAGGEAKRNFEQGFNSGTSPEQMGQSFSSKLQQSISKGLSGFELPLGMSGVIDKLSGDIDEKLVSKLKGQATEALKTYRQEYDNLAQAQARAAEADAKYNLAQENGFNKASIMLPLLQEQTAAHNALNEALPKANSAYDEYNTKVGKLTEVTGAASNSGTILAGVMGGAVVAGAQMLVGAVDTVVEKLIEGAVEAFKESIETAKEFADQMIELGETYEHIGIQVTEFSSATGESFEELEAHAQKVFGTLDVAGKDVGKTMSQFASMLDAEPGPALDALTKHVEELQGRFNNLKAQDLASIFVAFKTPLAETDSSLASLLMSARNSGQDLGQLTSALSGDAAVTLSEAGMNLQQAGAFMSELMKLGAPGRSVMMGLQSAMKEFGKEGLSFGDGMKMAGQRLKELGDTAAGQDLAEKLFGTRRWAVAMQAAQDYVDVIEKGPQAFDQSAESLDQFVERTRTLQNEWEMVKHKAEEAFLPFGLEAVHLAGQGLDALLGFVNTHMDQIKNVIKSGGLTIIGLAHDVEQFGIGVLEFMAPVADGVKFIMATAIETMGNFSHLAGEVISLIPGMGDIGDGLIAAGKSAESFGINLDKLQVGKGMNDMADWLKKHQIDVQSAGDEWMHFADKIDSSMDSATNSVDKSKSWWGTGGGGESGVGPPTGGLGGALGGGGIVPPGISGNPTQSGGLTGGFGGLPGMGGPGSGAVNVAGVNAALDARGGGPEANKALAQQLFPWPASEWPAFDQLEMHEAGYKSDAKNPGSGAFGMGQFLGHEHDAYASGYSNDPATQLKTMFQYISDRYGTPSAAWAQYYQHPNGQGYYALGGNALDVPATGGPKGTDTVPAWLTPGEYVWDKATVEKFGWLIQLLHGKGFQGGGGVGTGSSDYVANGGTDDLVGVDAQVSFVDRIAKGFGLTLTAGKSGHGTHEIDGGYHDSGEAGDFSNGMQTDQELAFAMYMIEHFGSQLAELIHTDPRLPKLIKDGKLVDPSFYGADTLAGHKDHVHVAVKATQAMSDLSPGTESLSAGLPPMPGGSPAGMTPGGTTGASFPGLPGQYGGYGAYGGENYDQVVQAQQNTQEAKDRASDLDYTISQNQKRVDDLKKQIAEAGTSSKTGLLTGQPLPLTPDEQKAADDKRKQLNDQLDQATHQLSVSQRERAEQDGKITEAQRKEQEAQFKKPAGATTSDRKAPGESEFSQLGSSLLGGIGQELGFGDLFAKPPWEWGAVKLLTGAASWAMGTANAWADEIGKGHTGMTGFQPIAGWDEQGGGGAGALSGIAGSLGIKIPLPKTGVSNGPNIVPGQPVPPGAPGAAPGGMQIGGDYMPINVQAGVDPKTVLAPVQEQQNANNASTFTHSGGFPAS